MLMVSLLATESLTSIDLKWGKTLKKIFSETMKPTTSSPINSANHASWV